MLYHSFTAQLARLCEMAANIEIVGFCLSAGSPDQAQQQVKSQVVIWIAAVLLQEGT